VNHLEEILLQEIRRFAKELWESVLASLPVLAGDRPGEETILREECGSRAQRRSGEAWGGRDPRVTGQAQTEFVV